MNNINIETTIDSTKTTIDSIETTIDSTKTTTDSIETTIDSTKTTTDSIVEKPKKKRGRKPKYISLQLQEEAKNKPPIEKKKRGRKPKNKIIQSNNISLNLNNWNNNSSTISTDILILFVPLDMSKINNLTNNFIKPCDNIDPYHYNPTINDINPFDPEYNNKYMELDHSNSNSNSNSNNINNYTDVLPDDNTIDLSDNTTELVVPFFINDTNNTHCLWDLHSFDNTGYTLPLNKDKCFGKFCCLECAAAYNFNELNDYNTWERYSLLIKMYNPSTKIVAAPPRILLNIFGGPLNIIQYRELLQSNKNIIINKLPLISINMQLEINNNKLINNYNYIPLTNKRLNEASTNLKLKREKPIDNKNTLDNCINLIKKQSVI